MFKALSIHAHIWLLARVFPFLCVWCGDWLYSYVLGLPFKPLEMLPIKLFCVATIAFPFLVLSGYARLKLLREGEAHVAGILWAAAFRVLAHSVSVAVENHPVLFDRLGFIVS